MLFILLNVQIKLGGKISVSSCCQTLNYPKYQIETPSVFSNQIYQVSSKYSSWHLGSRSNFILVSWESCTIDYFLILSLIWIFILFFSTSFFPLIFKQVQKSLSIFKKKLPLKLPPWFFFCSSLCNYFCWCIFFMNLNVDAQKGSFLIFF